MGILNKMGIFNNKWVHTVQRVVQDEEVRAHARETAAGAPRCRAEPARDQRSGRFSFARNENIRGSMATTPLEMTAISRLGPVMRKGHPSFL